MYEKRIKREIKEENSYYMEISEKLGKSGTEKGGHTGRDPGHIYTKKEKGITYAELSDGPVLLVGVLYGAFRGRLPDLTGRLWIRPRRQ